MAFLALLWVPHEWTQYVSLVLAAAMAFNLTSSIVYIINDFKDMGYDRYHPVKKNRPLVSGAISPLEAYGLLLMLAGIVLVLIGLIGNPWVSLVLLTYLALNLVYSYGAKHVAYLDMAFVAAFAGMRVVVGFLVLGLPIAWYMVGVVVTLFLFMKTVQRLAEVSVEKVETRPALKYYAVRPLRFLMTIFLMVSVVLYFFAMSIVALPLVYTDVLYFFVLFAVHEYMAFSENRKNIAEDGFTFLRHHKQTLTLVVLFILTLLVLAVLYFL